MKTVRIAVEFLGIFAMTLLVSSIVSLLFNMFAHGQVGVDWGSSLRLGIILGILLTWMNRRGRRKKSPESP